MFINYEIPEDISHIESDVDYRKLVASRDILQGETIVTLPLKTLPGPDKYSVEASPGIHIDCTESLAGAINHACSPNAAVRHFRIVAWNCISQGDEITIDYMRTEYDMAVPFKCFCCGTLIRGKKYVEEGSDSRSS
jgi:hypothetical protein